MFRFMKVKTIMERTRNLINSQKKELGNLRDSGS